MVRIRRSTELGKDANKILSKIFVDSYYNELKEISKNKDKLYSAFEHTFVLRYTYVAILNNEPLGFISCTNGFKRSMIIDPKIFKKEFGYIKGTIVSKVLNSNFKKEPLKRGYKIGFIDNVATSPSAQGKGIGTLLMNHILDLPKYDSYVLEVADNNKPAISLYEKSGFVEFDRVKFKHTDKYGIDYSLWMIRN